jgi:CYTH domain-containing protein
MSNRSPGEGRYAQLEQEQRWRLAEPPLGLEDRREIIDLYLSGMTLRLRAVKSESGVVYKLTQKVRANPADPEIVKITNIYLSAGEYESLQNLPATKIRKFRYLHSSNQRQFAIDVFADRHEGLVLAELELGVKDRRVAMPSFAIDDVSNDDRFSGGTLAQATDQDIRSLLRSPL